MSSTEIKDQVVALMKLKPKPGETSLAFTKRVLDKCLDPKKTTNAIWDELEKEAQDWVNAQGVLHEEIEQAGDKYEGRQPDLIEVPETATTETESAAEDTASAEEDAGSDTEAEVETNASVGAKAPARKAPARKKAVAPAKKAAAKPAKKAAAKKTAAPKKAAAKKDTNGASRGRAPKFTDAGKIKVLKDNPSRPGTVRDKAYKKLKNGMTVSEALKAGVSRAQLLSHFNREIIAISKA